MPSIRRATPSGRFSPASSPAMSRSTRRATLGSARWSAVNGVGVRQHWLPARPDRFDQPSHGGHDMRVRPRRRRQPLHPLRRGDPEVCRGLVPVRDSRPQRLRGLRQPVQHAADPGRRGTIFHRRGEDFQEYDSSGLLLGTYGSEYVKGIVNGTSIAYDPTLDRVYVAEKVFSNDPNPVVAVFGAPASGTVPDVTEIAAPSSVAISSSRISRARSIRGM